MNEIRYEIIITFLENADKLKALNEIVHPEVKAWVCSDIERQKKKGQKLYVKRD